MAKDPAFSFYAQDYLVDTFQWDRGSKSLHVDLLALSWINGFIEADPSGTPIGLSEEDKALWHARVKTKWDLKDGKLVNPRLEESRAQRKKFLAGQSEKGKKSAEKRTKQPPEINHGSATVQQGSNHLKSEIEKEIEIENIDGGVGGDSFSITVDLPLPANTLEAAERNQFALTRRKNTAHIQAQWTVFLAERVHDPPERKSQFKQISDLTSYFLNWIRNKHPNNVKQRVEQVGRQFEPD
jgi:uncharacterized protein YdaU (DUF1376 family)